MPPLVSILIVGYNGGRFVDSCLSAVLDQSLPAEQYEVIYVDNGSAESPLPIIRQRYPTVRSLQFSHNLGYAAGNNQAVAYAQGEYLLFLNQDTIVHHGWAEAMLTALRQQAEPGAVYANQIMPVDPEFSAAERFGPPCRVNVWYLTIYGYAKCLSQPPTDTLLPSLCLSGGAFGLQRATLTHLERLFDASYGSYGEDIDLGLRLQLIGRSVALAPAAVVYHATGSGLHNPQSVWCGLMAIRIALRVMRNRFATYYKVLDTAEFLLFLPGLLLGSPAKAWQLRAAWPWRAAAVLAFIPLTLAAWLWALVSLPGYRAQHRRLQAQRRAPRFWLHRSLVTAWLNA